MKKFVLYILLILHSSLFFAQKQKFTHQDSLRGSVTKERVWWNLLHYQLDVKVDIQNKYVSGSNRIQYEVLKNYQTIQIDLQDPMQLIKVTQNDKNLKYKKDGDAYFIYLNETQNIGDQNEIKVYFQGKPIEAINPPWDGGFVWKKDKDQNDFIANANQSIGASIWWPCKDNPYDEPDNGVDIMVTTPENLTDVSNGRLMEVIHNDNSTKTYHWKVTKPINSYAINVNIANYVHFNYQYKGEKGLLDCDYYVLPYHLEAAQKQFEQVPMMLEAFEHWFGPYPFYEDSFKLVEAPYLGMEHQSSVTYGNGYSNGYLGNDLSGTGWGLKFDFIIIHESGHEWFANNITNFDAADMWIHESFTTYSEILYLDYHFGTAAGNEYLIGYRKKIKNDRPIIGQYKVNDRGSNDMYIKGAAMIHTLRQIINDDEKFRKILRGLNKDFYHQTVSSKQVEDYISEHSGLTLDTFFDQYLRTVKIPVLQCNITSKAIKYRYKKVVDGFNIPVKVYINDEAIWLNPTTSWQEIQTSKRAHIRIDQNFLIELSK
ncbi:MAG: M1 family metallopeptidase [Flavobacteriaceae bacterium]|nr:M1 family metallopeptidase [Flavobacteriaceae bacterium]